MKECLGKDNDKKKNGTEKTQKKFQKDVIFALTAKKQGRVITFLYHLSKSKEIVSYLNVILKKSIYLCTIKVKTSVRKQNLMS